MSSNKARAFIHEYRYGDRKEIILDESAEVPPPIKALLAANKFSMYSCTAMAPMDSLTNDGQAIRDLIKDFYSAAGDETGMHYASYLRLKDLIAFTLQGVKATEQYSEKMVAERNKAVRDADAYKVELIDAKQPLAEQMARQNRAIIQANSKNMELALENARLRAIIAELRGRK